MSIKKTLLFLACIGMIGSVNAAYLLLNNGGFNVNAAGWNASGGGDNAWAPGHVAIGGNPGGYLTLESGNNVWSVWYQVINENLAVWGIPAGTTITVQADMIDLGTAGNNLLAGLKIESWGTTLQNELANTFPVTKSWETYSFDYKIAPAATSVKFVFTNVNYNGLGVAKYGYDNAGIGFPGGVTPALFPVPTVGNVGVSPANDVLRWTNPEPRKNPSDIITCDVWFRGSATPLADPNLVSGQSGVVKIVSNEPGNSVDLSDKGVTLQQDHYYYWKVNVIDPNNGGGPIVIDGFTWSFFTGDAPPVVSAGADQYIWLDGGTKTFTLTGSYTDDGKSPVTTQWSLNALTETDPETVVTIHTPNALTTNVTVDNTGWFFFDFSATDAAGSGVDTVNVGVYADACGAAIADPADPVLLGDINGDCKVDMNDLAILAADWIECMSAKLGCTP
jgi:hypothetical protein